MHVVCNSFFPIWYDKKWSIVWSICVCSVLVFQWLQNSNFLGGWSCWCGLLFTLAVSLNLCEWSGLGAWTSWDNVNSLSRFSWLKGVLWCLSSSVGWNLSDVLVHKVVNIWSHIFGVSNILLFSQVLELWIKNSVNSMLLPWVWSWVHAVVSVDESMNSLFNLLVTNISLIFLS